MMALLIIAVYVGGAVVCVIVCTAIVLRSRASWVTWRDVWKDEAGVGHGFVAVFWPLAAPVALAVYCASRLMSWLLSLIFDRPEDEDAS